MHCERPLFLSSDSGGLFSGRSIVKWMIETLHGVNNEQDAEILGQLLLDKGGIFHSEGSRCVCGVTCKCVGVHVCVYLYSMPVHIYTYLDYIHKY